jgi:hypothetical protein
MPAHRQDTASRPRLTAPLHTSLASLALLSAAALLMASQPARAQ